MQGAKMYFKLCQMFIRSHVRQFHTSVSRTLMKEHQNVEHKKRMRSTTLYWSGVGIFVAGLSYAAVPLYRIFCQSYGYGGGISTGHDTEKVSTMKPVKEKPITVRFNADISSTMVWEFKPQQDVIKVLPGETALAFYTAKNPLDIPVTGVSTYNVVPYEAGQYFNKIQCFCFEEQLLNPHEQVDMPVFFYIDPEIADDPRLEHLTDITLSYTFFEAKEGMKLPVPSFLKPRAA